MNCPTCGAAGAYIGFRVVECPSNRCMHYVPPKGVRVGSIDLTFNPPAAPARVRFVHVTAGSSDHQNIYQLYPGDRGRMFSFAPVCGFYPDPKGDWELVSFSDDGAYWY